MRSFELDCFRFHFPESRGMRKPPHGLRGYEVLLDSERRLLFRPSHMICVSDREVESNLELLYARGAA
jgi:hypothetical protein